MMMVLMKEVVILIMTVSPASKDPKNEEGNAQPPLLETGCRPYQVAWTVTSNLGTGLTLHK